MTDYRLIGIYSFGKGILHREPKPGAELGDYRFFAIEPGDLVLSNIQAWEGAIAYARDVDCGTIGTHRFLSYVPVSGRIDTNWARWFFLSEPGMTLIRRAAPGTTIRNRTLAIDRFEALEIPLPDIEEQREQAAYLDAVASWADMAAKPIGRRDADSLVALLPGLVDALIEQEASGALAVSELADFVSDTVHPGDDPAPATSFVGLQHVESHTGRRTGSDPLGTMKGRKFRFRLGDVIYGYLRPYLNKVWVADRDGLCSVDQYVLRPHPGVDGEVLAYSLRGRNVLDRAIDLTHSLQLPRLRSGLLASMPLPLVPSHSVSSLVSRLNVVTDRVVAVATKRRHQDHLVSALLPSALNRVFAELS